MREIGGKFKSSFITSKRHISYENLHKSSCVKSLLIDLNIKFKKSEHLSCLIKKETAELGSIFTPHANGFLNELDYI